MHCGVSAIGGVLGAQAKVNNKQHGDPEGDTTPFDLRLMHPLGKALRENGQALLGSGEFLVYTSLCR